MFSIGFAFYHCQEKFYFPFIFGVPFIRWHLTSLQFEALYLCEIYIYMRKCVCISFGGLFLPNHIDFNERTVPFHFILFHSDSVLWVMHDFQKCFYLFHALHLSPTPQLSLTIMPIILSTYFLSCVCEYFFRSSLEGLFITCASMKRRKHEKWHKKLWNRLNSEIKPATSMQPMNGKKMAWCVLSKKDNFTALLYNKRIP